MNAYLEPMSKSSSFRERSKRVADGVIAIPGTFVNGLVRANPKRSDRASVGETWIARYSDACMTVHDRVYAVRHKNRWHRREFIMTLSY